MIVCYLFLVQSLELGYMLNTENGYELELRRH